MHREPTIGEPYLTKPPASTSTATTDLRSETTTATVSRTCTSASRPGLPNRLFRNNGDATFTDVTVSAGVDILDDTRTALFADVENDGDQDLIAITASQPLLFRNNGRGHFKFDPQSGLKIPESGLASLTSAALADYDNDG